LQLSASSINPGGSVALTGAFVDPDVSNPHQVVIDWGDGSTATTLSLGAGVLTFGPISHTYQQSLAGNAPYTIQVTVSDEDGVSVSATTQVTVGGDAPPILTLSGSTTANPLSPYTLNLSSSDPDGVDAINSWTINWGDGTIQTVDGDPGSVTHTYALVHRIYTLSAQATSEDGTFPAGNTLTLDESLATDNENYIAQVYLDLLGRPVDPSGLQSWSNHLAAGDSRNQVLLWIMGSLEYRTLRVEQLYQQYLNRPADPVGLRNDLLALAAGTTIDQIKAGVLGSDEYLTTRAAGTFTDYVSALYLDVLGRLGTPGEIQTWIQGTPMDLSRTTLASIFIGSAEANQLLMQNFYQTYLHRPADSGGLSAFVQAREQGATEDAVIASFLASDEYYHQAVN
jgi:hypothetical protein